MVDVHDPKTQAASAGFAWAGVGVSKWLESIGIHAWSDVAAMAATIYSALLIFDWCRKRWANRKSRGDH